MFCGFSAGGGTRKTDTPSCSQSIYCEFSNVLDSNFSSHHLCYYLALAHHTPLLTTAELEGNIIMDSIHFISFRCDAINCVDLVAAKLYKQNKHEKCVIR